MSLSEFGIIEKYFHSKKYFSHAVKVGVGDDAAVIDIDAKYQWITTIDTLVENTHFFPDANPEDLGYKSLAVSLSDIAAMGAVPKTALLALNLPEVNEYWLQRFAKGFFSLAGLHRVDLVGGNITKGPLSISVVLNGLVAKGQALCRSGAKVGDQIYVTGTLGDAGLALAALKQGKSIEPELLLRLNRPIPRIDAGIAISTMAHAAIDISDGLAADLEKVLQASDVGAVIYENLLPYSKLMLVHAEQAEMMTFALTAGEDYELCFTAPPSCQQQLEQLFISLQCPLHYIGDIVADRGLSILNARLQPIQLTKKGYEHFANESSTAKRLD